MNTSIIQSQPTIALPEKPYPFAKINNKAICVALKSVNENFSKETFNKLEIALKILIENKIKPSLRPEELDYNDFINLSNAINVIRKEN